MDFAKKKEIIKKFRKVRKAKKQLIVCINIHTLFIPFFIFIKLQ